MQYVTQLKLIGGINKKASPERTVMVVDTPTVNKDHCDRHPEQQEEMANKHLSWKWVQSVPQQPWWKILHIVVHNGAVLLPAKINLTS